MKSKIRYPCFFILFSAEEYKMKAIFLCRYSPEQKGIYTRKPFYTHPGPAESWKYWLLWETHFSLAGGRLFRGFLAFSWQPEDTWRGITALRSPRSPGGSEMKGSGLQKEAPVPQRLSSLWNVPFWTAYCKHLGHEWAWVS